MDIEAIKKRLEGVKDFPVGTDSNVVEFLHGGKRDEATEWGLNVRQDEAHLIRTVERLQLLVRDCIKLLPEDAGKQVEGELYKILYRR